ncbi:hydantoinase/oxoprolinase family protein [Acuticoccus mangrovi]|uniref:hydantoinase/oxoprolinase family protein n=1 Tax=Acuticoccus mangrovi TaxID=2796142 RepID=UPI002FC5869A
MSWTLGIDVGGTFTDVCAYEPATGLTHYHKRPSTPQNPAEAILAGIAELCEATGLHPRDIGRIAHGTTVATNALIEQRPCRVALVTTEGFRDLLEIGRQVRPSIYDLQKDNPPPLVPRHLRFEVAERVTRGGRIVRPLEAEEVDRVAAAVAAAEPDAVAVCLLFSYLTDAHEQRLGEALRRAMPGIEISLSCEVRPEFREYERLSTTVLNAYLQPIMSAYLGRLESGIAEAVGPVPLGINQSSGGLISAARARTFPIRTALSGPAAGVAGAVHLTRQIGEPNAITLDIGGTSSDVALLRGFAANTVHERWVEGYPVRMPSVDIDAIGAGGGSIAWVDTDGLVKVGPRSAGAVPGPACYGRGGTQPTVSDANLVLGRLSAGGLLSGSMPMQVEAADAVIGELAAATGLSPEWTALGIIDIAVANMVRGIRAISVERGHDPRDFTLIAYGGAGPLHAASVARALGIRKIMVPRHPGLLCAQGLIVADQLEHFVRTVHLPLDDRLGDALAPVLTELRAEAGAWFAAQDVAAGDARTEATLEMRYLGQNFELAVPYPDDGAADRAALEAAFSTAHDEAYGFHNPGAPIEITSVRIAASGRHHRDVDPVHTEPGATAPPTPIATRPVWFDRSGAVETVIYDRARLAHGHRIVGPAIIDQLDTTTVIFPRDVATVDLRHNLLIEVSA